MKWKSNQDPVMWAHTNCAPQVVCIATKSKRVQYPTLRLQSPQESKPKMEGLGSTTQKQVRKSPANSSKVAQFAQKVENGVSMLGNLLKR